MNLSNVLDSSHDQNNLLTFEEFCSRENLDAGSQSYDTYMDYKKAVLGIKESGYGVKGSC